MARPASQTLEEFSPQLADQLVDQSLRGIARGSDRYVEWRCELGHIWSARPYNRTSKNGTGCPVCNGKKVLQGFNDLATTHPEYVKFFVDKSVTTQITGLSNKKHEFICDEGHRWTAPVSRLTFQKSGCPYCSGRLSIPGETDLATTHPELSKELLDPCDAKALKAGSNQKVFWQCGEGHTWEATPSDRTIKGSDCPYCSGRNVIPGETDLATTHPELAKTLLNPQDAKNYSAGSDKKLLWRCPEKSHHQWLAGIYNRIKSGCPVCDNKIIIPGENDLATHYPDIADQLYDQSLKDKLAPHSGRTVLWICQNNPLHKWEAPVGHRTGKTATGCPHCANNMWSQGEKELIKIIKKLLPNKEVLANNRKILPDNTEVDIIIPSHKIAIEFNGVYWHSDAVRPDPKYHYKKTKIAKKAGYQLIHIWEDDWAEKKDLIIRILAHKLYATDRLDKVLENFDPKILETCYARKLKTVEVGAKEARPFLENNHIQGFVTATHHFALKDNENTIRAILSCRSARNNARMNRPEGVWEIQRYATLGKVPGGFSKLIKHAERFFKDQNLPATQWVSFSSNDISDGNLYAVTGFTCDKKLGPDYKYIGNHTRWKRAPKERYQKKHFRERPELTFKEHWTERQAAETNKLYRLYDSGKHRWRKNIN